MPQRDTIHEAVRNALIKEGWNIKADPYTVKFDGERVYIDFDIEAPFEAEREGNKIVVEVKSFQEFSLLYELHQAVGQYINYSVILDYVGIPRLVYLALSGDILKELKLRPGLLMLLRASRVRCIIVETETEEVSEWIDNWDTNL